MLNEPTAKRLQKVKLSPTLAINNRAAELKKQGRNIISMGVGEPDFDTPTHICQAAINAINEGKTRYTAVGGTSELKRAIQKKFFEDNHLEYTPDEILVSTGGKQSIFNLLQALINPGDEVIIPAPYWVSYPPMVNLAEGCPVIVSTNMSSQLKITAEQLNQAITPKTRLFILNSPSNPTGVTYTTKELKALADVLQKHQHVMVATDDMYEHIYWGQEKFTNILMVCPELKQRAIVLNGVSKAYAMTGWRIGYAAAPKWLIKNMTRIQSQSTSNPCSIAQAAAVAALNGPKEPIKKMVQAFKERYAYVYSVLKNIPDVNLLKTDSTFYCFPDLSEIIKIKGLQSDIQLAEELLEKGVAIVPGSAFGAEGFIRLSYAMGLQQLKVAMDKLQNYITN